MTGVVGVLRRTSTALRPAARGWRIGAVVAVVLLLALGSAMRLHPAGLFGGGNGGGRSALAGSDGTPGGNGAGNGLPGTSGGGGANQPNGVAGATASPGAGKTSAGSHPSPTPSIAMPTPSDAVYGTADVKLSDCGGGYEPGTQCTVYYHGLYDLASHPMGKLLVQVIIDGTAVVNDTFVAPAGAHRFGDTVKFTVPQHAKKIVYQSVLEDATGTVLVTSAPYTTYGYG